MTLLAQDLISTAYSNVPEFTVGEISGILKRTIEDKFSFVRVKGEISGLKIAPSGHVYFSLKDESAVLAAICWKGNASRLPFKPEDGLEVVCTGSITTFANQSKYQLIAEKIEPSGAGALMTLLMKRKELLFKEGLFDVIHKKKLPFLPKTIGVITSPTGAVIKDILHRLQDRFPVEVLIWPVLVQGDHSAKQVASAIHGFNTHFKPDLIIIARGGGSLEDLWSFNEEIVVRSAAASLIPIISAIGHETDYTLLDLVADVRAPTPTAAAEMAVPVLGELRVSILDYAKRNTQAMEAWLLAKHNQLISLNRGLPSYDMMMNNYVQRIDDFAIRLNLWVNNYFTAQNSLLSSYTKANRHPQDTLNIWQQNLSFLSKNLDAACLRCWSVKQNQLQLQHSQLKIKNIDEKIAQYNMQVSDFARRLNYNTVSYLDNKMKQLALLNSLCGNFDYRTILQRGYVLVRNEARELITTKKDLQVDQPIILEFADGEQKIS
jgi:exodeoxyribonuclease VII large subunit